MADELVGIANISWDDEDRVREEIAARVNAQSSTDALLDEEKVRKAWSEFQDCEHQLARLQGELEEVMRQQAGRANGVQVISATSTGVAAGAEIASRTSTWDGTAGMAGKPLSIDQRLSRLRFAVRAAARALTEKQTALQRTQTEVERRRRERLHSARVAAADQARAEEAALLAGRTESNGGGSTGAAMNGGTSSPQHVNRSTGDGVGNSSGHSSASTGLRRGLPVPSSGGQRIPRPVGSRTGGIPIKPTSATSTTAHANVNTTNVTRIAVAPPSRVPSLFPLDAQYAVTAAQYSGGAVLPALHRVQVTRADLRARHLRYDNDNDMDTFNARQRRRRRLEMLEAIQRHRRDAAAAVERDSSAERSNSFKSETTRDLKDSETAGVSVKTEGTAAGAVTINNEDDDCHHRIEIKDDVIDVDALMEAEEALSPGLLRELLTSVAAPIRTMSDSENSSNVESDNDSNCCSSAAEDSSDSEESGGCSDSELGVSSKRRRRRQRNRAAERKRKEESERAAATKRPRHESLKKERRLKRVAEDEETLDADIERAYAALNIPPEPVITLLPAVTIPESVYNRLLEYQQEGLQWLVHLHAQRSGGILGDEMGLGKTVQVAALLHALHHSQQLRGPALVVAPMTVLQQWVAELHRWAPRLRVCVMHESGVSGTASMGNGTGKGSAAASRRALLASVQGTPSVVVTTYAGLRLNCPHLVATGFQYVIVDEGHKISNPGAGVTLAAKSFTTPHRLILSGSPIQNRLKELWCLFDFVRPGLLGSMERFVEEFEEPIGISKNIHATPMALVTAVECAKALQSQIAPYLLRRLKKQVRTILPKKFERVVRVPLSDEQLELYVELVASHTVQQLIGSTLYQPLMWGGALDRDGRDSTGSLHVAGRRFHLMSQRHKGPHAGIRLEAFRVMNRLRQICNDADLFKVVHGEDDDYLDDANGAKNRGSGGRRRGRGRHAQRAATAGLSETSATGYRSFRSNNPVNLEGSSKLRVLLEMAREWAAHGHRALIFTQTRMMLDIIENLAEQEGYRYIRMDGTTPAGHRQELMDRFNEDMSIFLALLTTRVGGIGVNLVGADRVVIFDPDWNPVTDVQARERAWRIGQTRDVCVYRLITSGTVEEAILRRQLSKTYVTDKVLKDPKLQRFFQKQENLVESFFLGREYDARVPVGRKHVLVAQDLAALPYADAPGGEQEKDLEQDEVHDYGRMSNSMGAVAVTRPLPGGLKERHDLGGGGDNSDTVADGAASRSLVKMENEEHEANPGDEREFGFVVRVDTDHNGDAHHPTDDDSPTSRRTKANNARGGSGADTESGCETQLLQKLFNGQDVSLSGSDPAVQSLARSFARQKMARLAQRRAQPSQASLLMLNPAHSLTAEAERQAAKDAADRAEQRAYFEAAQQRRRC